MSWIEQQIDRLMRGRPAGFRDVLAEALEAPATMPEAIQALEEVMLESADDARLAVEVLEHLPLLAEDAWLSPIHTVMGWLEDAEAPAAHVIAEDGLDELLRIFDALVERIDAGEEDPLAVSGDAMSVLRILVIYRAVGALERVVSAAGHPTLQDSYLWTGVFEVLEATDHPWRLAVVTALTERWPAGYAQVALLDHANVLAFEGELASHPFDTPEGWAALEHWLHHVDDELIGAARSAVVGLTFVDPAERQPLLARAESHPEVVVRIEAAAVRAAEGEPSALERLSAWATDPRYAEVAIAHLERLDAVEAIPVVSQQRDFRAAAAMASWLAQPSEFDRPPDELVMVDSRELHWPPTGDRRRVWLFRYRYATASAEQAPFEGLGMVGSVTFAMADEDTERLSVAEAYGLHCAWELEMMDDARAPPVRDPKAGLRILRASNPDL